MATKFNPEQACNRPAAQAEVRFWVSKTCRKIETVDQARRRIKVASKAVELCRSTPGCDAQHHVLLAHCLRTNYGLGA
jgi:hypothetical protein